MANTTAATRTDICKLRSILSCAKNIVVLTGAGISAESGIPTFRGSGGFWRTYKSQDLASVGAFQRSPSLVWEFYHYRRELVLTKQPNKAHLALAEAEARLRDAGRKLTVITQNVDGLHQRAGSKDVVELHGSLFKTLCLKCKKIEVNTNSPICPALKGMGAPDAEGDNKIIPEEELPRCSNNNCKGLLRPYIVWFGENLHEETICEAECALDSCEACLVVGTSSVVYPAAAFAPALAERNIPVAEFNLEPTPATSLFKFHFEGPCTEFLPEVLKDIYQPIKKAGSIHNRPSFEPQLRRMSTDSKDSSGEQKDGRTSMKDKLKLAVRDYGSTVIVVHITTSLALLGVLYAALSSGLDMSWMVEKAGFSGTSTNIVSGASTFVMAYAINKVLAPLRFSITFACTPFVVRYLRSVGFLKPGNKPPPTK